MAEPSSAARLGLAVPVEGLGLEESLELAIHAQDLGYSDAWSYEVDGTDGFTPLAWLAARTDRLRLGISLIPAFTRSPALLGMSCASLQQLAGGRFVLGLGSSSPTVVERWMGGTHDRPLARVRETVEALKLVLGGQKVNYHGETVRVDDFRLGVEPAEVLVMLGALGPKMFSLAGEIGDGVILVFNTPAGTTTLLSDFRAGAEAAGRDPDSLDVVDKIFVAVDEDGPDLEAMLRRFIVGYGTVPAYNRLLARQGFGDEARAMAEAWADGRRADALDAVSAEMLGELIVFGSADHCAKRLDAFAEGGAKTLLVAPITAVADPDERRRRVRNTIEQVAAIRG